MVDPVHVAEVGPAAAILYARISWRSQHEGQWKASRGTMAQETGLSLPSIRTALAVLRDREWVTAERASALDATLVWRPVLAGQTHVADSATSDGEKRHLLDVAESAISSTQTVDVRTTHADGVKETDPPMPAPADAPALFVVPAAAPEPPPAEEVSGPPKTAQTLVARWCDGYREANGRDAAKAFMGRVAGQAKQLAKACGEDHDEWVGAYHAAHAAGRAGQADMTRFLVATTRQSKALRNVFADPVLGGPDAAMLERFTQAMNGSTPRALGASS